MGSRSATAPMPGFDRRQRLPCVQGFESVGSVPSGAWDCVFLLREEIKELARSSAPTITARTMMSQRSAGKSYKRSSEVLQLRISDRFSTAQKVMKRSNVAISTR